MPGSGGQPRPRSAPDQGSGALPGSARRAVQWRGETSQVSVSNAHRPVRSPVTVRTSRRICHEIEQLGDNRREADGLREEGQPLVAFQLLPKHCGVTQAHAAEESDRQAYPPLTVSAQGALHGQQPGLGTGADGEGRGEIAERVPRTRPLASSCAPGSRRPVPSSLRVGSQPCADHKDTGSRLVEPTLIDHFHAVHPPLESDRPRQDQQASPAVYCPAVGTARRRKSTRPASCCLRRAHPRAVGRVALATLLTHST